MDAARELDTAPSTVHRLLAMLMAHGFVARDVETKAYVPGEVLVDLGMQAISQWDFVDVARPIMTDLVGRTGETTTLGVLRRSDVLFVVEVESDHLVRIGNQLGQRVPAFLSSAGRALLAQLSPARVRELYPRTELRNPGSGTLVSRDDLEADLATIRARGWAVNDRPHSLEFASIAIPIRRRGHPVAALATAAPRSRVDETWQDRMLRELQECGRAIESALR